jgi:hypothetical protein
LGSLWFNVAVLLLPMTFDTLIAGRRAFGLFGALRGPWTAPSWPSLLQGVDGLFGGGWWGWLLPVAFAAAVVLARHERLAIASKLACIAALTLVLSTVSDHHWLGSFMPDLDVLLALYGTTLAVGAGLAVAAIESDVRGPLLAWRPALATVATVALALAIVPFVGATGSGRFDLPSTSVAESLSTLHSSIHGGYRVLWLGDPSVLPVPGWSVSPGLAAATSMNGLPGGNELFTPPSSGTTDVVLTALHRALDGQTVNLAAMLRPAGITAIVVMSTPAPPVDGGQQAVARPVSSRVLTALSAQTGLSEELTTSAVTVYANTAAVGIYSEFNPTTHAALPLFGATSASGALQPHWSPVVVGLAPASAFALDVQGSPTPRTTSDGWAPTYTVPATTRVWTGDVSLHQFPLNGLLAAFTLGMWLVIWLGFGWIARLEWLFTGRRRPRMEGRS